MSNPTRTEAIKTHLSKCTHADLAELYSHDHEVQVNVAQDGGTRVDGDFKGRIWHGWSDGVQTWKPFRIPYKANTDPEYEDRPMGYDLATHAEGIGLTGWNWKQRRSEWVAFDFDAITGHSEKHSKKMTQIELEALELRVNMISWTTLRRSTSGRGLHLYIFLDPFIETQNHSEHSALARAILSKLSALTGFDFESKVDVCGGNMWVWHRKMTGTNGLSLLKRGTVLETVPINWKDHIPVTTGRRRKTLPKFIADKQTIDSDTQESDSDRDALFEELTTRRSKVTLDTEHRKLIEWLERENVVWWWDNDLWMLVTHTHSLKRAHEELSMRGVFETLAKGTETPHDYNCFLYPCSRGGWIVRRYSPGVDECKTWTLDSSGWRRCFLNQEPDLKIAALYNEGIERPGVGGGYVFTSAEQATKAALLLGANLDLPNWILGRDCTLKSSKDNRLIVEIEYKPQDQGMPGWLLEKGKWIRIFDIRTSEPIEADVSQYDDVVRHLMNANQENAGWIIKSEGGWKMEPLPHIRSGLKALGYATKEVEMIVGSSVLRAWAIVNEPFKEEWLPDRRWNRNACQLRFKPTPDKDNLSYPTWLRILANCGKSLDGAVADHSWAKSNGILTGADYLKCWIASMFQFPHEPLPYLFFWGEQIGGKSMFHEALTLLVTSGITRADTALQTEFNGELVNAILAIVEETDLKKNNRAYNKIKDWVTSRQISIHAKNQTPYLINNSIHFVQCANDFRACPIFPGDTRITMIRVDALPKEEIIIRKELFIRLEKEAPDFLAEILGLEIPTSSERLNIPVIVTNEKAVVEKSNRGPVQQFIDEHTYYIAGEIVNYTDLFKRFYEQLDPSEAPQWTKNKFGRDLPPHYPKGKRKGSNEQWVGNISFDPPPENYELKPELALRGDFLVAVALPFKKDAK